MNAMCIICFCALRVFVVRTHTYRKYIYVSPMDDLLLIYHYLRKKKQRVYVCRSDVIFNFFLQSAKGEFFLLLFSFFPTLCYNYLSVVVPCLQFLIIYNLIYRYFLFLTEFIYYTSV